MVRRAAFTLIELIFAIVIIAISVMSLPMMSQVVSKGIDANMVQEAIFAAATELNEVTTANWDDQSMESGDPNSLSRVIDHSGKCEDNASLARYRLMPGHIAQPLHRRCLENNATTPDDDATTKTDVTSLNDFVHNSSNIFVDTTTDDTGYKRDYNATLRVTRPANFNGSNNDIKLITITVTNSDGDTLTSLKSYSANIGEIDYYKKEY